MQEPAQSERTVLIRVGLLQEEQLAVFREGPEFVVDEHLEVIGIEADPVHQGTDFVAVETGAGGCVGLAVGLSAGGDKLGDMVREVVYTL